MAWTCGIIGSMIGDAQPDGVTFWAGACGQYEKDQLPDSKIKVSPLNAYVTVWPGTSSPPSNSTVAEFDCADLVRCGTGPHGNLAYEGWKATVSGLAQDETAYTTYSYQISISGTSSSAEFGVTEAYDVSGTFQLPPKTPQKFKVVFSSCQKAYRSGSSDLADATLDSTSSETQPAWGIVKGLVDQGDIQLNVLLGDTTYANSYYRWKNWEYTQKQLAVANYASVIARVPTYAIYDDHDFIDNNIGGDTDEGKRSTDYGPVRERASRYFNGLFIIPPVDDQYRTVSTGCFQSFTYQGVLFVMLDTLYNRSQGDGATPSGTLLGDDQWRWLEAQLATAGADTIKVICSSTTLESAGGSSPWDWRSFPDAIIKLTSVLTNAPGGLSNTLFVSGDIHQTKFIDAGGHTNSLEIPEVISSGIGYNDGDETYGFAVVEFDPANSVAEYNIYNDNTAPDGGTPTTIQWAT